MPGCRSPPSPPTCPARRRCGGARMPEAATAAFPLDAFADRDARDAAMADWLLEHGVSLVVLAGYMHILRPSFLGRFPDRVVNVHPALLPAFPGCSRGRGRTRGRRHRDGCDGAHGRRGDRHRLGVATGARAGASGRHERHLARAHPRRRASPAAGRREGARRGMRRALLSVYDKTGASGLCRGLAATRLRAARQRRHR